MSLRSFLIAASALILGAITGYAFLTERALVETPLQQIQASQIQSLAELATSILRAKQYLLTSFAENTLKDKTIAKTLILAQSSELTEKIRKRTGCDVVEIQTLADHRFEKGDLSTLTKIRAGESVSRFISIDAKPILYEYSPIKLYDDVVGILALGFSLNESVASEINQATRNRVSFHLNPDATMPNKFLTLTVPMGEGPTQTIYLEIDRPQFQSVISNLKRRFAIAGAVGLLLITLLGYFVISFGFLRHFRNAIRAFDEAATNLDQGRIETLAPRNYPVTELTKLFSSLAKLLGALQGFQLRVQQKTRVEAAGEKAAQVAHDLNGPLSALEMAVAQDQPFTDEHRHSIRQFVDRIRNTVSVVSERAPEDKLGVVDLYLLTEEILTEKRIRYFNRPIELNLLPPGETPLLAVAEPHELQRVLANIIDNAFEAIAESGKITIALTHRENEVTITVTDSGRGIAKNILAKIGERGFTFGKTQGSGLGLWHARQVLEKWQGSLRISSRENKGTIVVIKLRAADVLTQRLLLKPNSQLIILDDDLRIHDRWERRLKEIGAARRGVEAFYFTRAETMLEWLVQNEKSGREQFFLFDHDLGVPHWNGLKLISSLKLKSNVYLVTGATPSAAIYSKCWRLNVRLIPKSNLQKISIDWKNPEMMKATIISALIFAALVTAPSLRAEDLTTEWIVQHEIELKNPGPVESPRLGVVFLFNGEATRGLNRDFFSALVRDKLKRRQVPAEIFGEDFISRFKKLKWNSHEMLAAKLLIELTIEQNTTENTYVSNCHLSLIEYEKISDRRWRAKVSWSPKQGIKGISKEEIEDNLGHYIQKELNNFPVEQFTHPITVTSSTSPYTLHWKDPDPLGNRLNVGVSLGTPSIGNLNLIYWGTNTAPFTIGFSGMYYSDDTRGFQLDAGWIFDNDGNFRQAIGVAAVLFNETTSSSSNTKDEFGRTVSIQTDTVNALRPFVGPTYTAVWNNFRAQAGITYRADASAQSTVRFLFQLGYLIPAFSFSH